MKSNLDKKRLCYDLAEFCWDDGIDFDSHKIIEWVFKHPEVWQKFVKQE